MMKTIMNHGLIGLEEGLEINFTDELMAEAERKYLFQHSS